MLFEGILILEVYRFWLMLCCYQRPLSQVLFYYFQPTFRIFRRLDSTKKGSKEQKPSNKPGHTSMTSVLRRKICYSHVQYLHVAFDTWVIVSLPSVGSDLSLCSRELSLRQCENCCARYASCPIQKFSEKTATRATLMCLVPVPVHAAESISSWVYCHRDTEDSYALPVFLCSAKMQYARGQVLSGFV